MVVLKGWWDRLWCGCFNSGIVKIKVVKMVIFIGSDRSGVEWWMTGLKQRSGGGRGCD